MGIQQQTQEIIYPESDGKPMADNTKQFQWILYIYEGDVMVVFGRPKGHRGSYLTESVFCCMESCKRNV